VQVRPAVQGLAWVLLATASSSAGARSDDAWSWAEENAEAAWTQVSAGLQSTEPDATIEWSVHVVAGDGWGRTAELLVRQPWKGTASVAYVRTLEANLLTQLHSLRESEPSVSVPNAARRLRVQAATIDAASCPALRGLAERLPKIRVPALQDNTLSLHASAFDVTLSPATRLESRSLRVEEGEDDLARWCAEIVAAVVACEEPRARQ
jgi:hypothetical protein